MERVHQKFTAEVREATVAGSPRTESVEQRQARKSSRMDRGLPKVGEPAVLSRGVRGESSSEIPLDSNLATSVESFGVMTFEYTQ